MSSLLESVVSNPGVISPSPILVFGVLDPQDPLFLPQGGWTNDEKPHFSSQFICAQVFAAKLHSYK